jgi:NhaP-type Na+/H+ or K+/H+ antiporter
VSKGAKIAYRPIGLLGGILAGTLSGIVFKQIWKQIANEEDAPDALQSEYPMREVVLAAALQGAIFAATKAAIERAGARGFTKLTGSWPGD